MFHFERVRNSLNTSSLHPSLRMDFVVKALYESSWSYIKIRPSSSKPFNGVSGWYFTRLYFISILSNHVKGSGPSLKCCFEVLTNLSVSYHLSEPPGAFCTPTWSAKEYVVVDEHGNVDEAKVVYFEPQKLILKQDMDEKVKEVTYRKDCQQYAYAASCQEPCNPLDLFRTTPDPFHLNLPRTTSATQALHDQRIIYITCSVVAVIIIISVIWLRRKWQSSNATSRCMWKAVSKNESPTVAVSVTTNTFNDDNTE